MRMDKKNTNKSESLKAAFGLFSSVIDELNEKLCRQQSAIDGIKSELRLLRDQVSILTGRLKEIAPERSIIKLDKADLTPLEKESAFKLEAASVTRAREELPNSLTIKEAAQELGVTTKSIHNYMARGLLDSKKIGGRRMIPQDSLEAFRRKHGKK